MKKWILKDSKLEFDTKFIKISNNSYELPNGQIAENYYHLERPNFVLIVGVDSQDRLLTIKQYRRGVDEFLYELPAGWVDENESPEVTGERELKEETGFTGKATFKTTVYPIPAFSSIKGHIVFVEIDESKSSSQNLSDDEEIEYEFIPLNKVKQMILDGAIKDMGLITALAIYLLDKNTI